MADIVQLAQQKLVVPRRTGVPSSGNAHFIGTITDISHIELIGTVRSASFLSINVRVLRFIASCYADAIVFSGCDWRRSAPDSSTRQSARWKSDMGMAKPLGLNGAIRLNPEFATPCTRADTIWHKTRLTFDSSTP